MLTSNALIKLGSTLNNLFYQVVSSSLFKNTQQDEWSSWFKDSFDVFNEKFGQLVAVEFDKVGLNTKQRFNDFASICVWKDAFWEGVCFKAFLGHFQEVL